MACVSASAAHLYHLSLRPNVVRRSAWGADESRYGSFGTAVLPSTADSSTSTSRFRRGEQVTLPTVMGHISTSRTVCPGQYLEPRLTAIQASRSAAGSAETPRGIATAATVATGRHPGRRMSKRSPSR